MAVISLLVVLMTKLSRFAKGVGAVQTPLKPLRLRYVFFSFRLNRPNAPLLAPRVRGRALSLTRHTSSTFSVRREQKRAQAVCHQNQKAASAHGAEVSSTKARSGAWLMQKKRGIQKC